MPDVNLRARWNGEVFVPVGNWSKDWCITHLRIGEIITFEPRRQQSDKSRGHQFAWLHDAWASLPESLADMSYAGSPELLRKHALIATGFHSVTTIDCGSIAAAERVGAQMKSDGDAAHGYCIVQIREEVVRRFIARSQRKAEMGHDDFQRSKDAVLTWVSNLVDATRENLIGDHRDE